MDFEVETFLVEPVAHAFPADMSGTQFAAARDISPALSVSHTMGVAHVLRGEGFDASEDGTERGVPIVPIDMRQASRGGTMTNNRREGQSGGAPGTGIGEIGDPAPSLSTSHVPAVAGPMCFTAKDHGADAAADLAPTMRAMGHGESHANGGGQLAVAFDLRGREGGAQFEGPHETANLRAASGGSSRSYVATRWAVRRLTPLECSRLQGFPDDHARIPWRGKPAEQCPDGPQYKTYGNSMAVNVMAWIGRRLDAGLRAALMGGPDGAGR